VLAFGHDEELSGFDGAAKIAEALPGILRGAGLLPPPPPPAAASAANAAAAAAERPPLAFVLDEGLFLLDGGASSPFPGHPGRVALVCVGEKGHVNVELSVACEAGHSSAPPVGAPGTSIGILARAITRLEASPFPAHASPASAMFEALLPGITSPLHRLVFANLWASWPLVRALQLLQPASAAMLRTTTAVTMARAGIKSNVLPPLATCVVNHRIHPRDSVASVLARDVSVIGDARVRAVAADPLEPAPVSSTASAGFRAICGAVRCVFGERVEAGAERALSIAPGLMLGNTDTRHYWRLATDIYRHCPIELRVRGLAADAPVVGTTGMFHGRDERISIDNLARLAAFYATVLGEADGE
jgi:carboxypeptidase PM20D1